MLLSRLRALCSEAEERLVLVAPFIKYAILDELLGATPAGVIVTCVTRWRPEEIAAGVSDLEVWPLFREVPGRELLLRQDLHAKYFRADSACLVGSANLTAKALGASRAPNLELLDEEDDSAACAVCAL